MWLNARPIRPLSEMTARKKSLIKSRESSRISEEFQKANREGTKKKKKKKEEEEEEEGKK